MNRDARAEALRLMRLFCDECIRTGEQVGMLELTATGAAVRAFTAAPTPPGRPS